MITVTAYSKQQSKQLIKNATGFEIVKELFPDIKNSVIALKVKDKIYDLSRNIDCDIEVEPIRIQDELGLEIIRHDAAHIMAQAVKELFGNVKVAIGPTVKDGFYYDFDLDHTFSPDDLSVIEKKMAEIVKRNEKFVRIVWSRQEAIDFFSNCGEQYKVELISSIPEGEDITVYKQGDFIDLCRGPHSPSTGWLKAFKLMKVSGAYWRGDANKPMLQRIYGTAWRNNDELKAYLHLLEESEKRDHRKIAKEMDLFHIQDEATGQVFWHEKGWTLYRLLEAYIREKLVKNDYKEVKTPILLNRELWEQSGHWDKFHEHMFISEAEGKHLAIKPMNCPCHVQIFNSALRSYRDLPLRMAEFGLCHRNEPSGSLHGLMRVRGFTQDDAHIFCAESDITKETLKFCDLLKEVYQELGFNEVLVKFSDRPERRAGSDEVWDKAEKALIDAVQGAKLEYSLNPGEGAFYGPKLEFVLKDALGRHWQCGTLQVDFVLPERLGAFYIDHNGQKQHPVMLHRAILGTFERFIGILIEHYAGKFPLWLAPVQVAVLTVTSDANEYAQELQNVLLSRNIRSKIDLTNEQISYKIRNYSLQKVPILWIIGKNEVANKTISVRRLGIEKGDAISLDKALEFFYIN